MARGVKGGKSRKSGKARKALSRPQPLGWATSDEDEILRRRERGAAEIDRIETLERQHPIFGTFRVTSMNGSKYDMEIRDLKGRTNSCDCPDWRVNGLGTCKHIEGVLAALKKRKAALFRKAAEAGSERVEIFLDRTGKTAAPSVHWPKKRAEICSFLPAWARPRKRSRAVGADKIEALLRDLPQLPAAAQGGIRVSRHFAPWLERTRRIAARIEARQAFAAKTRKGGVPADLLAATLLPYQQQGMLHLAFGERALLADEMGLGKTIQAIAACELLKREKNIKRVLVVCPASVKAEWEEQIARFAQISGTRFVAGPRAARLFAYTEKPAFYTIVNYEQVVGDVDDINRILKPDVVILDEAQRIKNWQTKTARKVKLLNAPYAFVLTGTPIENRIDEIYSIVQYLDAEIFGPLFRFNRDFYRLDERGRPSGYKNFAELNRRLGAVMLRRRKADVETELPQRTVKNFFVAMEPEQQARYDEYAARAAIILAQAKRRPLLPKEFERLQQLLACMRMICDTPAILDPTCRISPKLAELEGVFDDLMAEPGRKIVVFSEWERMLDLVRELAGEMGLEYAWHTGSVPQRRRRVDIARFKTDPDCRLFLTTDAGATGLNLQTASAVVNIDLPWNPAKLEQRIARVWRKYQTRKVTVVNLVTENSIEHNMLGVLAQKQTMADSVLDGRGADGMDMPSGRQAVIERIQAALGRPPRLLTAEEALADDLGKRFGEKLWALEAHTVTGEERIIAVIELDAQALAAEKARFDEGKFSLPVEFVSRESWDAMQRLVAGGFAAFATANPRILRFDAHNGQELPA